MGMGSMDVTVAATEREVHEAAVALWPFVQSGQVGFPLAGKKSREGLETVWSSHPEREGDELYIVRCGPVIIGACGFFLSDAKNAQTVCGPVAVNSHEAVYAQLVANMQERHPLASIIVGISHRHVTARAWLKSAGELLEHCLPFEGINLAGSREAHVFADDEQDEFARLFDRLVGHDLWWRADRIRAHWGEWICVTGGDGQSVLAARNYVSSAMSEVFAASALGDATLRAMLSTWISTATTRGYSDFVYFADLSEREVVESLGFSCDDEYLAFRVPACK